MTFQLNVHQKGYFTKIKTVADSLAKTVDGNMQH